MESQALIGQTLVDSMIAGDDAAWRKFLADIGPLLRAICLKAGLGTDEIEDVAQALVLKLLDRDCRALRRLEIEGDALFRWSKVVISRAVVDHVRRRSVRQDHEHKWGEKRAAGERAGDSTTSRTERRIALESAVGRLAPEDRTLFWFRYRDLSDVEIARLLGVSLPAAQKRLSRMRKRLRKHLDEMGLDPWE